MVKLNGNLIISCKLMNIYKVFDDAGRNKHIVKRKTMMGGEEGLVASGSDGETRSITDNDVLWRRRVGERDSTRFGSKVVGGNGIHVPCQT